MSEPIKTFLSSFMQHHDDWKLLLIKNWQNILGDMSSHVTCEKIENQTITLGVYDSCWMQELYLLTPTLLTALNAHFDQPRIASIRFKNVSKQRKQITPKKSFNSQMTHTRPLSASEQAALAKITDQELLIALKKFLMRCHHTAQIRP